MKNNFYRFLKKEYLFLYLIILIGAFLRLQGVFTNSFAFTYDVGRDMLELWNIAYLHKIPLIGATTGLPGVFYGPWWYFFLTPFFFIFSGNPQGLALMMSLVGIASIFLGFMLGRKIGGSFLGLSLAALISTSPVFISLSAQIWNPNVAPLFVLLILVVLHKIYSSDKANKLKYYFLLGLLLVLVIDLEIIFGLLLSLGIIISVILIVNKRIPLKGVASFVLGWLVILLPRIVFELRHGFLMTKSFFAFFFTATSSKQINTPLPNPFIDKFGVIFSQFNSTLAANNRWLGLIVLIYVVFSTVLFYKKSEENIRNFIKTSVVVILVFLTGTIFFNHDIWPHYLVGVPVFYILLCGIGFYNLGKRLSGFVIPAIIIVVLFILNLNPAMVFQSLTQPLWEGDDSVYRNQLAVVDYVYKQANGKSFKFVVYTPGVNDYVYKYLFKWYGPWKYHYSPTIKVNTAYFILEPDYQDPTRLPDWLKKRSGDGIIIKDVMVKAKIRVQTRLVH